MKRCHKRRRSSQQHYRQILEDQQRREIVAILTDRLGQAGFEIFLKTPQPDFCDRTGQELLEDAASQILTFLQGGEA